MKVLKRVLAGSQPNYKGTLFHPNIQPPFTGLQHINPYVTTKSTKIQVNPDGRIIRKLIEPVEVTLLGKEELSTDAFVYRFGIPDAKRTLGHETC